MSEARYVHARSVPAMYHHVLCGDAVMGEWVCGGLGVGVVGGVGGGAAVWILCICVWVHVCETTMSNMS